MLSFDWFNFICMIINLLILYFLMKKFLFGRVDDILKKRKEEIEADYRSASEKAEEAEGIRAEYEEKLKGISEEREKIIHDADQKANAEYSRIVEDAGKRAEDIIRKAKAQAEHDNMLAMKEQEKQIEQLVLSAAGKIAASSSEADNARLYDRFLKETKKTASGGQA